MSPQRFKAKSTAEKTRRRTPRGRDRSKAGKPRIFQWTDQSGGMVEVGRRIELPPVTETKGKVPKNSRREGPLTTVRRAIQRWFGKGAKPTPQQHRLHLSPKGLSTGGISLRWIDIGEISVTDKVIEIFVVPVRQGRQGCTVMRYMQTTYTLEVPADRIMEIESAIRQSMVRWKPPLKGPFLIAK